MCTTVMAAPFQSDTSSSDDEENLARFKEAAVDSNSLVGNSPKENGEFKQKKDVSHIPSLRPDKERDEGDEVHHLLDLHTTPGFQKHVAKKLTVALDSEIDTSAKCFCSEEPAPEVMEGIRLFSRSKALLTSINKDEKTEKKPQKRRPPSPSSDDSSEDEKLAEAAVSHDFIVKQSHLPFPANQKPPDVVIIAKADDITAGRKSEDKMTSKETCAIEKADKNSNENQKKKKKKKKHKSHDDSIK